MNKAAVTIAATKLSKYKLNKTKGALLLVNSAVVMKINTFSLAEHREKGITNIDSRRKPGDRITLVPIIAGTLHPNPIRDMTNERPSNPNLAIKASIKKAERDGKERVCRVRGKLKRRVWIREGDVVLVSPWDFQADTRGDIFWRYRRNQTEWLRNKGYLKM